MPLTDGSYWCEAVARSSDVPGNWLLSGYRARSARLAVRWLRGQAARLADALDPQPGFGVFAPECLHETGSGIPNPGRAFRDWLADARCQAEQMSRLAGGDPVSVSAGGPDRILGFGDTDVLYSLSARPSAVGRSPLTTGTTSATHPPDRARRLTPAHAAYLQGAPT